MHGFLHVFHYITHVTSAAEVEAIASSSSSCNGATVTEAAVTEAVVT